MVANTVLRQPVEAFDELGIKPGIISGTSIGAIFGAAYASGITGNELRTHTKDVLSRRFGLLRDLFAARSHSLQRLLNPFQSRTAILDPVAVLAALSGFEIAMLCGAVLRAALERRVIVVDGFLASSAVPVAARLQPATLSRCVFAHCSDEASHALMLRALGAMQTADLQDRLQALHSVTQALASCASLAPDAVRVQSLVAQHYDVIRQLWGTHSMADPQADAYAGLGQLYVDDARFLSHNGMPRPLFARFLRDAMAVYSESLRPPR